MEKDIDTQDTSVESEHTEAGETATDLEDFEKDMVADEVSEWIEEAFWMPNPDETIDGRDHDEESNETNETSWASEIDLKDEEETERPNPGDTDVPDDKPGVHISYRNNKANSRLETRKIQINGVDIEYVISTTKLWKWIVDDCQVIDSFKIDDPDTIKQFIDTVVFSYPDLVKNRKTVNKNSPERENEIKDSFFWEWLAHNWMYKVSMFWDTSKDMENKAIKNSRRYRYLIWHRLLYKFRSSTKDVDLDDENLATQRIYKIIWCRYLKKLNKNK